jgi:5-methylcytosine-specific restriction endonuclease McrA
MSQTYYHVKREHRALITAMPCAQCGREPGDPEAPIQVDHIRARANGGKDELSNYQPLCAICNQTKSDKEADYVPYFSSRVFDEDVMRNVLNIKSAA